MVKLTDESFKPIPLEDKSAEFIARPKITYWSDAWRRFKQNKLALVNVEKHKKFVQRILEEDLFYPIVMVNDEIVAEGIPRLKTIYAALDKHDVALQT